MLPVQFALAAPPSDHDSIGLISHLPLAVQFPLGATRSISMLTRVIREMQLSLRVSMLTRSLKGRPNGGSAGSSSPPLKQQPHTMGGAPCLISACYLDLLIRRSGDRLNLEKSTSILDTTFGGGPRPLVVDRDRTYMYRAPRYQSTRTFGYCTARRYAALTSLSCLDSVLVIPPLAAG